MYSSRYVKLPKSKMKISQKVQDIVLHRLGEIEEEHNVQIMYAIESGSRAWGFESEDSDYDVRFIYKHKVDWYLSILPKRDVIEYPIVDEMDYSGWDLRKSFFLANKSNPVLFEWMNSPLVYRKNEEFHSIFYAAILPYFSGIASMHHYLHMANRNYREYLRSDLVKIKKYFYVLRPIFCCLWIEKYETVPPMEFEKVMAGVIDSDELTSIVGDLLEKKRNLSEMGQAARISALNTFIEDQLEHIENRAKEYDPTRKPDSEVMNEAFVKILDLESKVSGTATSHN